MMTDSDKIGEHFINVSIHEASHAVAAHVLGLTVRDISVRAELEDYSGVVNLDGDDDDKDERLAIVFAAGEQGIAENATITQRKRAEAVLRGGEYDGFSLLPELSAEDDAGIARYLRANYFSGVSARKEVQRIKQEARRLVREHWPAIIDVSIALNDASTGMTSITSTLSRSAFLEAIGEGTSTPARGRPAGSQTSSRR